uniref:Uncharacterized protein n=1 Tax=Setaria italica TaxID=4555 RepID=K3ZA03_SETIT
MEMEQWSSPMTFIRDAAASTCSLRCMPDAASAGPPARRTAACPAHAPRPPPPTSCARTPPAQAASVACCLRPHAAGAGSQGAAAQSECGKGPCSVRSESKLQLRWDVGGARASLPRRMGNGQQAAGQAGSLSFEFMAGDTCCCCCLLLAAATGMYEPAATIERRNNSQQRCTGEKMIRLGGIIVH